MKPLLLRWSALVVLLGLLIRIIIAVDLAADPHVASLDIAWAFVIGAWQDLLALVMLSGFLLAVCLIGGRMARVTLLALVVVVLVVAFAELFFWWEFENRLNRLVFHYLLFPREVITFLEDQFYVSLYALPALALMYLTYRLIGGHRIEALHGRARHLAIVAMVAAVAIGLLARPWEFSVSRRVNQMASNGYLGVARAATIDVARWAGRYWRPAQPLAAAERAEQSARAAGAPLGVKHVVLIVEESFGGAVWNEPELRTRYLPHLSELITRSVYFDQIYATGSRTTRGLEALLNGFPPLPGIALTQRKGHERLPALPRALSRAGFHNVFVYGGWPGFSNFFPYWQAIGYDELTSRHDFQPPYHETSWGVADEFLFARVRAEMTRLSAVHKRIFLTTLTVSHHRPFDFPAGRIPYPAEERRSEYALAYADWALDRFLEESSADPWFDDTLFVIVADHGPRTSGDTPIPVDGYRVPLLFYSPAHLEPRRLSHLGSTMSVPVTLLELLGLEDVEGFYGDNLLTVEAGLVPVEHEYQVGLLTPDGLTVLHRGGALSGWRYEGKRLVAAPPDLATAAQAAQLFGDAHAWFYGSTDRGADER